MASRILLISANQCRNPDPVFPLGLSYLNAALRTAGHECGWLDSLIGADQIEEDLKRWRPDFVGISLRNIDDVLIRKRETFFEHVASLVSTVRRVSDCPVILGGSGFSIFPQRLLEMTGADFGIAGEGEAGLVGLIAALESGNEYRNIPGLLFRESGQITMKGGPSAHLSQDLSIEDRPRSITNYYLSAGGMLNVQTQRGCAFRCCYCTYPLIEGRQHRRRAPESVAAEFEQLQEIGARYIFIVDSVFNSTPGHVAEICEALLQRNVQVPWGCFLRPQGLSTSLMRLLKRAGLAHVEFGTDSLCDEVLTAYQKGFTFDDIARSSELARNEQIDFCHFLIAGGPGETPATLQRGFENSQKLHDAVILAVAGMRIYPGTDLYERAVAEGRISRQDDLLRPAYYLSTALTEEEVFGQLQAFSKHSSNWIVGDPDPIYLKLVERLHQRGVVGPLWSYFSTIQRLGLRGMAASSRA